MKHLVRFILLLLLPMAANSQINWNNIFGKQRFNGGFGLACKDTSSFALERDSSSIVLQCSDSTMYYRYKGYWRQLGGGTPTIPNLDQVLTAGNISDKIIWLQSAPYSNILNWQTQQMSYSFSGTNCNNIANAGLSEIYRFTTFPQGTEGTAQVYDGFNIYKYVGSTDFRTTSLKAWNTQPNTFRNVYLPDANGTMALSVNGYGANPSGQIFMTYDPTAVPYVGASGTITTNVNNFSWNNGATALNIGANMGANTSSSISLNASRFYLEGNFSGAIYNVGSGMSGGGVYDQTKKHRFYNRGNLYLDLYTINIIAGVPVPPRNYAVFSSQIGIGTQPNDAAALEISSTDKGLLLPRMTTTQVLAIASPPAGLVVYNTTLNEICFYDGTSWRKISHSNM